MKLENNEEDDDEPYDNRSVKIEAYTCDLTVLLTGLSQNVLTTLTITSDPF